MEDAGSGKNEAARWSRLLRWLKDKHGMNTNQLAVEARSVEGTSCRTRRCLEVHQLAMGVGAGRGLFATKSCPVRMQCVE